MFILFNKCQYNAKRRFMTAEKTPKQTLVSFNLQSIQNDIEIGSLEFAVHRELFERVYNLDP
jgi:hypothetical protein